MPQLLALDRYLPRPSFYSSYWDKFCSVIYHMVKVKKTWIFHIRLVWALSLLPANIKYTHFKLQNLCLLSFSDTCALSSFSSLTLPYTAQKMKFFIKDFSVNVTKSADSWSHWSHLLKKSLMENFIFCAVLIITFGMFPLLIAMYKCDKLLPMVKVYKTYFILLFEYFENLFEFWSLWTTMLKTKESFSMIKWKW